MENYNQLQTNILFIAQLISVFISSAALIAVLWQTKDPYKKKIKIDFKLAKSIINNDKLDVFMCIFTVINNGNVNINIEEFGIMNSNNKTIIKINNSCLKELNATTIDNIEKLPIKLETQSKLLMAYSMDSIVNQISISKVTNKKNYKKLILYFKDSLGKITKKSIPKKKNLEFYIRIQNRFLKQRKISNINTNSSTIRIYVTWYNNEKGYGLGRLKNNHSEILFLKSSIIDNIKNVYEGDIINIKLPK